jgi:hypothetical protein
LVLIKVYRKEKKMTLSIKITEKTTLKIQPTPATFILAGAGIGIATIGAGFIAPTAGIAIGTARIAGTLGLMSILSTKNTITKEGE